MRTLTLAHTHLIHASDGKKGNADNSHLSETRLNNEVF